MIAKSPSADRIPIKSLALLNHIKAITDQKSLHLIFQTSKQGSGLVEYRLKIVPVEASVTEAKRREEVNQIQGASIPPFVWGEKKHSACLPPYECACVWESLNLDAWITRAQMHRKVKEIILNSLYEWWSMITEKQQLKQEEGCSKEHRCTSPSNQPSILKQEISLEKNPSLLSSPLLSFQYNTRRRG